jgi:hypothetical protein
MAMTDRDRGNDGGESQEQRDPQQSDDLAKGGKDVMRGRSFAGANIANTEREQTRERQRIAGRGEPLDEFNEVTDAEIEARERERNED